MNKLKNSIKDVFTFLVLTNIGRIFGSMIFSFIFLLIANGCYDDKLYNIFIYISLAFFGIVLIHFLIMMYYAWIKNGLLALIKRIKGKKEKEKMIILSLLFLALASICNAIMDKTSHHFEKSIFSKAKNRKWWYTPDSWKNKYIDGDSTKGRIKWFWKINKPVQLTDAWHFFKMLMIFFIVFSIISYKEIFNPILDIIIYGSIWNLTFILFYKKIFKLK